MADDMDDLRARISTLNNSVAAWYAVLDDLRQTKTIPQQDFLQMGLLLRADFEAIRGDVERTVADHGAVLEVETEKLQTLDALAEVLRTVESIRPKLDHKNALDLLDRIGRLEHVDFFEWPPLSEIKENATLLLNRLRSAEAQDPVVQELASSRHSYARLLRLALGGDLSDAEWDTLKGELAETINADVVRAAARQKLKLNETRTLDAESAVKSDPNQNDENVTDQPTPVGEEVSNQTGGDISGPELQEDQPVELESAEEPSLSAKSEAEISVLPKQREQEPAEPQGVPLPIQIKPETLQGRIAINEEMDSQQIANLLVASDSALQVEHFAELAWQLVLESRLSLGYQVLRLAEARFGSLHATPPSWVLAGAIVGPKISEPSGPIAATLAAGFERFDESLFIGQIPELRDATRLLLIAMTLRSSIVAPNCGASSVLKQVHQAGKLTGLYELCGAVADITEKLHVPLDPVSLSSIRNQTARQAEVASLQKQIGDWWRQAQAMTLVYAPATVVWRSWIGRNGILGRLLAAVAAGDQAAVSDQRKIIEEFRDEKRFGRLIRDTHRKVNPSSLRQIEARALQQLRSHANEACTLADRWLALKENSGERELRYTEEHASQLRTALEKYGAKALDELTAFGREAKSRALRAATKLGRIGFESMSELFDPDAEISSLDPPIRRFLNSDLLRADGVDLDDDWAPGSKTENQLMTQILTTLKVGLRDWKAAFEQKSRELNHEATRRIVEFLAECGSPEAATLEELRAQQIHECQEALRRHAGTVRAAIEAAVAHDLLHEADRATKIGTVEDIEQRLGETERFDQEHQLLRIIGDEIEESRLEEVSRANELLAQLKSRISDNDRNRILEVLRNGDVPTAIEYMQMAEKGTPLPSGETRELSISRFFPNSAQTISKFLEDQRIDTRRLVADIAAGRGFPGVTMANVPQTQAEEAGRLLEAWFEIKRTQQPTADMLRRVLEPLGFSPERISIPSSRRSGAVWVGFHQPAIEDRERCPVAAFGSHARGDYRILCQWQRLTADDLFDAVGDTAREAAAFVFYFGRMTERVRRDLARLSRRHHRIFVVVDDLLILFLCGERARRLRTLFECALPFTSLEPYSTTASFVPPEVFYGRERERQSVIDPMGSCFIFGGRQLGKTALLRDIERRFHRPTQGQIAIWFDLKTSGIGTSRPLDDLWVILAQRFKNLEIVPPTFRERPNPDALFDHIANWLAADRQRRILLLLDEADSFLEQDGSPKSSSEAFMRADRLKGLMDSTDRRFKVVFAGLHNVQRATRLSNHPLAHYGEPICIGPLLNDGQWREARRLVEEPLTVVGYKFESEDLITRILSQTNYFPSLIQLYCAQLLRHLHRVAFDPEITPPYMIVARHVEDAYLSQELRKAIRDRFTWTLQLDPRYQVIALSLALHRGDTAWFEGGFAGEWIYDQVLTWWPEGFQGLAHDSFRNLLDEMVGLGVLRTDIPGKYLLRSPNIALLIGTDEEIERELFASKEAPPLYEPSAFRSARDAQDYRRNAMTARQESDLCSKQNGVALICGAEAASIDDLKDFLPVSASGIRFSLLDDVPDQEGFQRRLREMIEGRPSGTSVSLLLVSQKCPWTLKWVRFAIERIEKLTSRQSLVRIAFLADPLALWGLLSDHYNPIVQGSEDKLLVQTLGPWADSALRQWLDDSRIVVTADERSRITSLTGNWPSFLYDFYQRSRTQNGNWRAVLDEISLELNRADFANKHLNTFGIIRPQMTRCFEVLREFPEVDDPAEAASLAEVEVSEIERLLTWSEILGYAHKDPNVGWQIDPILKRLLETCGKT